MSNLREALTAQWTGEQPLESDGFLRTKVFDLLALFGLGLALMASFALTGIGTAFASVMLNALGLGQIPGARLVLVALAVAASVAGMWLVFLWVIARLPREPVPLRSATRVTNSPTGQLFGPVIGLMVFAYFVSRFLLFVTAWAAVVTKNQRQVDLASPEAGAGVPEVVVGSRPDLPR
jgi:membrane protein